MEILNLFDKYLLAVSHPAKQFEVTRDLAEDIDLAGRPDLLAAACGRRSEKNAEGLPWRLIRNVARIYNFLAFLKFYLHRDAEVDLMSLGIGHAFDRQRLPNSIRCGVVNEFGLSFYRTSMNGNPSAHGWLPPPVSTQE